MSHYRANIRKAAREALAGLPRFAGFTVPAVWPGALDAETLPVLGVLTPQERREQPSRASVTCRTLLQVVVRRRGSTTIEDELDEDSEEIEAAVTAAFLRVRQGCFLEDLSVVANTDGYSNIGTLVMSFRVTTFRNIPAGR